MSIETNGSRNSHWNYFIALEQDLERASRYVEFSEENFSTYSLEFAHLMFAAASEVEVVLKRFCTKYEPTKKPGDIQQLKAIVMGGDGQGDFRLKRLPTRIAVVPRFGLRLQPWTNWAGPDSPDWWTSYNGVKHNRHDRFKEANLRHTLNAMAALFLVALELECRAETSTSGHESHPSVMLAHHIDPRPRLFGVDHRS